MPPKKRNKRKGREEADQQPASPNTPHDGPEKSTDNEAKEDEEPESDGPEKPMDNEAKEDEESEPDEELLEESPVEDIQMERGDWADKMINETVQGVEGNPIKTLFSATGTIAPIKKIFEKINLEIKDENYDNDYNNGNATLGCIPPDGYAEFKELWMDCLKKYARNKDITQALNAVNRIHKGLSEFNETYHLPETWNIDLQWAEQELGKQVATATGTASSSSGNGGKNIKFDFQTLKTMVGQRRVNRGGTSTAIYWWKTGKSTECLVQYGSDDCPIHRIESTVYHNIDLDPSLRIRTENRRSFERNSDGTYKYHEKNVEWLLAVGWRIPSGKDPGEDPLQYIRPPNKAARSTRYPRTEIIVLWDDNIKTLEPRGGLRRLMRKDDLADHAIYVMAEELEANFMSLHGSSPVTSVHFNEDKPRAYSEYSPPEHKIKREASHTRKIFNSRRDTPSAGTSSSTSRHSKENPEADQVSMAKDILEQITLCAKRIERLESRIGV